jgi:predicted dehydrogenase
MATAKIRVGIIGTGDVAQVVNLPTIQLLSYLFETKAVCEVPKKTAGHCAAVYNNPISTTARNEIVKNEEIDAVILLTSEEYHASYSIAALEAAKFVLVELGTLSIPSVRQIIEAEKTAPNGARVFVGRMRRYAAGFDAFKWEIANIPRIYYARVRDIIGQNSYFIGQSGIKFVKICR